MINLVRADFYRMVKSRSFKKSFWIISSIIVVLLLLTFKVGRVLSLNSIGQNNGFYFGSSQFETLEVSILKSSIGATLMIFVAILFIISDMVIARYKNGTIKNTLAYGESRSKIYLSNFLAITMAMIILVSVVFSIGFIVSNLLGGKLAILEWSDIVTFIKITLMIIFILMAVIAFYMLVGTLVKNSSVVTGVGILAWIFIPVFLSKIIEKNQWLLMLIIRDICGNPSNSTRWPSYIITITIALIGSLVAGVIAFKKQDI